MAEPYGPDESVSKLEKIKIFAQLLINSMPEDDYLGIVTFGTKSNSIFPLTKMSDDNKVRHYTLNLIDTCNNVLESIKV